MATDPVYAASPNVDAALVHATLDTSLTAPSNVSTIFTAGSSGAKIDEIVVQGVGTTVAGVLNIWRHNGSSYFLYDQVLITAVTSSATAAAFRERRTYPNLLLEANETLRISQTVSGNQSMLMVHAIGGNL